MKISRHLWANVTGVEGPIAVFFSPLPDRGEWFRTTCPTTGRLRLVVGVETSIAEMAQIGIFVLGAADEPPPPAATQGAEDSEESWMIGFRNEVESTLGRPGHPPG